MKQVLVISGKGGTGKTTLAGVFARLAAPCVMADCDVDAADLHIILSPEKAEEKEFFGGSKARIDPAACISCGACARVCRYGAVRANPYSIDHTACEGCGVCVWNCPAKAIVFEKALSGRWGVSSCRFGTFAGARLEPAEENSGKLVALIRGEAKKAAEAAGAKWVILDGPPGIGCPVLASIGGVDAAVAVAEPTLSGIHDFGRLAELLTKQGIKGWLLVNKWDLNPEKTEELEKLAAGFGFGLLGRVPFDDKITEALLTLRTAGEDFPGPAADAMAGAWKKLAESL
ncbi:MAG TPA: (4Fe-4S)-binding protein [Elusimicrobia bacterium]|nr:(4Fe-4S)-binding protein [Elusimicrobiota bacterium]